MATTSSVNWEEVLINIFAKTCNIATTETSFNVFFDANYKIIFEKFHIENATEQEKDIIKNILNESYHSSIKTVFTEMIKNPDICIDHICDLIFECICPLITHAIRSHKELKPYLEMYGTVDIPLTHVVQNDLVNAKGDYFILSKLGKIYKRTSDNELIESKDMSTKQTVLIGFGIGAAFACGYILKTLTG